MSDSALASVLLVLLLLVGFAQLLGHLFVKLRQPKVVGEILAGIVLGPALLGRLPSVSHLIDTAKHQGNILDFVYWLGLLLLMFLSGAETQQLFTREERREVAWLGVVGTGIPFVLGLILGPWLIRPALAGPNGNRISLIIILAVGVAVTSVPVVSKIFADLKILHTRFARLVLGVAVLEDIALWLALAVATAVAGKTTINPRAMSYHLLATIVFFLLGLTIVPRLIKKINKARFNVVAKILRSDMPSQSCSHIVPSPERCRSAWFLRPSSRVLLSCTRKEDFSPMHSMPSEKFRLRSSFRFTLRLLV